MQEIDIILQTHNHLELTINCVEALYRNTNAPFQLAVVDDSTDLTPTWFAQFHNGHNNLNYIRPKKPLKSGNDVLRIGLEHTKNEFVAFLGNSTVVEPYWVDVALSVMQKQPDVGMIGFKILYPNGIIEQAGMIIAENELYDIGRGEPGHRYFFVTEVDAIGGTLLLLRREAIDFDQDTYIGFRRWIDMDNCLTIRKNGWKILCCEMGCAIHFTRATANDHQKEYWEESEENKRRFYKKWPGGKVPELTLKAEAQ